MKNAIGYIRVITDEPSGKNKFGLETQKEQIIDYCIKNNYNIVKWFNDEDESSAKEHFGFDEILYGEIINPPYEAVIVAKSNCVARDIKLYYYYKLLLQKKNIELYSVTEDFGQMSAFVDILEDFTTLVAQMERDNINKRTTAGRAVKAARGGYSGGRPPYGYTPQNGKLVIVPKEAEIVRYVISAKDSGVTYQAICDKLNSEGKTNRSGTKFSISTIQVIVENKKLYQGMYRYGKSGEWVKGQQEPILNEV